MSVLDVRDLQTHFFTDAGVVKAVDGVSFTLGEGEVLGLVGESGSGKSVTGFSILRLVDPPGRVVGGQILFRGQDLAQLSDREMRGLRGNRIAMIFQDPMTDAQPGSAPSRFQIAEALRAHDRASAPPPRRDRAVEGAQRQVGIPLARGASRGLSPPLLGRHASACDAIAIAHVLQRPKILIVADEPTTALDVTIQSADPRLRNRSWRAKNTTPR
jgi:peptide/nickel transport system ATP-binding protein